MDAMSEVNFGFYVDVLKEPRGIIRPIQFVLSIFAFATISSYSSSSKFKVYCPSQNSTEILKNVSFAYCYPFDLEKVCVESPVCSSSDSPSSVCLLAGSKASAQFFVAIGVLSMIYCLVALALYIFLDNVYRKYVQLTKVDFAVSAALTLMWFISSSAWAGGLSHVKEYTDPSDGGFFDNPRFHECDPSTMCSVVHVGNYGSLNASVIFGFLNTFLWLGNLWFLYKETPWSKVQSKPAVSTPGMPTHLDTDAQIV